MFTFESYSLLSCFVYFRLFIVIMKKRINSCAFEEQSATPRATFDLQLWRKLEIFLLSETSQIKFETYRARSYYRLLLRKKKSKKNTNHPHTGPERWERDISIDTEKWTDV